MFFICHSQFYWQRNWSSESSHTFPKSHSYSGRAGIWIKVYLIPVTILIIITLTKAKYWKLLMTWGFPGGSDSKESACNAGDLSFNPWVRKREWQPTLVFLPGKFHEQRSLVSYSPWDHKKSDTTEQLTLFQKMDAMQSHFRIFLKYTAVLKRYTSLKSSRDKQVSLLNTKYI